MIAPNADAPLVHVAADLALDASSTCTQTLGAIAAKGGGKSYLASVIVEGLYDAAAPFAVFDPIGNWHSLTLSADGKSAGLAIVVVGGERADVPLDDATAELVGGYVVERGASVVFDVSELSKKQRKVYIASVAEAMFRAARRVKRPYMVVFEEAQLFAPQVCPPGEQRMLGAVTDIVRLGRNHGLGSMLITQRPQSVAKEVLNQVECLFVGSLRGPQERKAIAGWISEQGADDARGSLDELPKLAPGEFFCWSPGWLRTFKKIRVAKKRTFDGSSTPVLGQRALGRPETPKGFGRSRGLETLISALGALSEVTAKRAKDAAAPNRREDKWIEAHGALTVKAGLEREKLEAQIAELSRELEHERLRTRVMEETIRNVRAALDGATPRESTRPDVERRAPPPAVRLPDERPRRTTKHDQVETIADEQPSRRRDKDDPLDGPMHQVLTVLAQQKGPIPRRRLALLCRYAPKGGGFNNVLSRLRVPGFITGSGEIEITDAGRKARGPVKQPPRDPAALFQFWVEHPRVDGAMVKLLTALRKAQVPLTTAELAEAAGYVPNTGGFNNPLSRLRTLGLVLGKGKERLRLTPEING